MRLKRLIKPPAKPVVLDSMRLKRLIKPPAKPVVLDLRLCLLFPKNLGLCPAIFGRPCLFCTRRILQEVGFFRLLCFNLCASSSQKSHVALLVAIFGRPCLFRKADLAGGSSFHLTRLLYCLRLLFPKNLGLCPAIFGRPCLFCAKRILQEVGFFRLLYFFARVFFVPKTSRRFACLRISKDSLFSKAVLARGFGGKVSQKYFICMSDEEKGDRDRSLLLSNARMPRQGDASFRLRRGFPPRQALEDMVKRRKFCRLSVDFAMPFDFCVKV